MSGPGKSHVPSYIDSSSDRDSPAVGRSGRTFRGWDFGHSSSSSNLPNHEFGDESTRESGQSYSSGERRLEERIFESSYQFDGRSLVFQNPNINLNAEETFESRDIGPGHNNLFKPSRQETGYGSNTDTSTSLSMSSSPENPSASNPEHLQYQNQTGPQVTESSSRNFCSRPDMWNNPDVLFPSRSVSSTGNLDPRPNPLLASSSTNPPNQYHRSENSPDISRNTPAFPWTGGSLTSAGERGFETNFLDSSRNSREHPVFPRGTDLRIMAEDPDRDRHSLFGNDSNPFPSPWISHHNLPPQGQRLSEMTPWSLFSHADSESGARRAQRPHSLSGSSMIQETGMDSGSNNGHRSSLPPRTGGWFMEAADDELHIWHNLSADIEGRQRLISEIQEVLNTMRRIENLRSEDYMMLDPFINGMAGLQDRHRDMRLDVDNMSYEELLALEEEIGNVSTGLNEETIRKDMQQRKFIPLDSSRNTEPCCVCQEEYVIGDDIGTLECGHDFHMNCIKQWLTMKNLCPICKMTALGGR